MRSCTASPSQLRNMQAVFDGYCQQYAVTLEAERTALAMHIIRRFCDGARDRTELLTGFLGGNCMKHRRYQ